MTEACIDQLRAENARLKCDNENLIQENETLTACLLHARERAEYYEDLVAAYVPNRNLFFLMQEGYGQRL
jgi:hypothetical protein